MERMVPVLKSRECLIFFHLPKAGGSTISKLLQKVYPKSRVFHFGWDSMQRDWDQLESQTVEQLENWLVIDGHMPFGVHSLIPHKTRYFTILREPIARVVSAHRHLLEEPAHPLHNGARPGGDGLLQMIEEQVTTSLDNEQTRFLCGIPQALRTVHPDRVIEPEIGFGECTSEMLRLAKQNLEQHFDVVGLLDRFDEAFALLRQIYRWPHWTYHRANIRRSRGFPITPELRQSIASCNQFDVELYEFAGQLLDRQLASTASIKSTIRWHRRFQRVREQCDRVLRPAEVKLRTLIRGKRPKARHAA